MTAERVARLVAIWARFYTRGLAAAVASRRVEEIRADVHDHVATGRARGESDRSIAVDLASRMLRGLAADVAWRRRQSKIAGGRTLYRSVRRVALGVVLVLALPLVAMQLTDQVVWSVSDFVVAGILLAVIGGAVELAIRKAGNRIIAAATAVLGAACAAGGEADDAPGLVLLGLVLIACACALGVRAAQHGK